MKIWTEQFGFSSLLEMDYAYFSGCLIFENNSADRSVV